MTVLDCIKLKLTQSCLPSQRKGIGYRKFSTVT